MKKFLMVVLAVSLCLMIAGVAVAAEKARMSPAMKDMQVTKPVVVAGDAALCPPGWSYKPMGTVFHCERKKPANPCPQGYTVKWTTCSSDCTGMMMSTKPECQNCTFTCLPVAPPVPNIDCKKFGAGYQAYTGFCEVGCRDMTVK
ncbi:MAG: hypothetical protein ACYC69_06005 [Thermodesulfovibrionales bacterium]